MQVSRSGSSPIVELVRLAVVVLATAVAYEVGLGTDDNGIDPFLLTLLGAGLGYVAGGALGRFIAGRVVAAEHGLRAVSSQELLAGAIGGIVGLALSAALTWPVLLFGGKAYTLPMASLVTVVLAGTGIRVGRVRGGDLLHALGATGRLQVATPSAGRGTKIVDTSALVDGRLLDVCRTNFVDGTLVVPQFVLAELQGLADSSDDVKRARGRRGLDVLAALQRSAGVAVEVTEHDMPEIDAVDAKLVGLARQRGAALITVDSNLGRVAEITGVPVMNLHTLADRLRPPVLPGEEISVRILKPGRDRDQGVGYLADGTMVVVEGGRSQVGGDVTAEVTSILSNPNGRMVFATTAAAREVAVGRASSRGGPQS